MKFAYTTPVAEIVSFDSEDIITTSNALVSLSSGLMDDELDE